MKIDAGSKNGPFIKATGNICPPDPIIKNIQDGMADNTRDERARPVCQYTQEHAGKKNMWKYRCRPAMTQVDQHKQYGTDCNPGNRPVFFFKGHLHITPKSSFLTNARDYRTHNDDHPGNTRGHPVQYFVVCGKPDRREFQDAESDYKTSLHDHDEKQGRSQA